MTLTATLFISSLIGLFLIYVISLIKRDKLAIRYALYWVVLALALLLITWFPSLLTLFAGLLGIYSEINMVFFIGFCLSLWVIFWLTNKVSQQAVSIRKLSQQLALLEKRRSEKDEDGSQQ